MNKILLACILSLSVVFTAKAQVEFSFGSDSLSTPGGTVDVDVLISGFDDIISMQLSFNWDASVYSFSSIENVTDQLDEFNAGSIGTPDNAVVVQDGQLTLSWSGPNTAPRSLPDGTRLFTVRLNGVGSLCGSTQIQISNTPRVIEVVNNDFEILDATATGGNLAIYDASCEGNTGGGDDLSFTLGSITAAQGETICIPVTADNFNDIFSFQTGLSWDPSILRFTEIRDAGLQSVNANDAMSAQGLLNILWLFDQSSVTLADGTTLFEICFEVVGSAGSTSVRFVDNPGFPIEIADGNGRITDFMVNDAQFTVGGSGTSGVGLIAGNISTGGASSICIPITTRDFDAIGAFQAGVTFDPAVLRYTGVNQGGLSGVDIGDADSGSGELKVLWQADFSTPSVTLADNTVLFELCFDIIGAEGTSSAIAFASLQDFPIEFSSEIGRALEFFVNPGRISVTGMNTGGSDLSMTISTATISAGQTACLDVIVEGFQDIQGMGFAFEWDPAAISFAEVRNFNLPSLGTSQFVPSGNNRLRVLWNPTSAQSVADGTSIFQLCFTAPNPCTVGSSSVSFISDNIPIEIIGPNNEVLDVELNNGTVAISGCGSTGGGVLDISLVEVRQPTCHNNANGGVTVDFPNAVGTVMCLWTRVSDQRQITLNCNLLSAPGETYELTATDQGGNSGATTVTLSNPAAIVIEGDESGDPCNSTGQIALRVSGGTTATGGYQYAWSGGLPSSPTVSGLAPATYQVTVTDDNGCAQVAQFVLTGDNVDVDPVVTNSTDPDTPNGSIDLNPGSGAMLTYSWSTGETTSSISGLAPGEYSVEIRAGDGCISTQTFTVSEGFISGSNIVDAVTSRYNGFGVSCNGESDGILDGMVQGGCDAGAIEIQLNGSVVTLPVNNLPAGEHTIRIADACGNVFEETFFIEEPDPIELVSVDEVRCPTSGNNGILGLNLSGGTGVYSLTSSVGNQGTDNEIDGVGSDPITVVVQDENGCQVMFEDLEFSPGCTNQGPVRLCEGRTIISPNGDRINDLFEIPCVNDPANQPNSLSVFDRWGNCVLEANNYTNDWDGTDMSGEPLPEGGYMWVLTTGGAGSRDLFRGTVSILR